MIDSMHICIDGEYYKPITNLTDTPIAGKKIAVNEEPLTIRCVLRYVGEEINLYIDLEKENKNEK